MRITQFVTAVGIFFSMLGGYFVAAQDERLEADELIKSLPILSSDNAKLRSFHFTGEILSSKDVSLVFEVGWSRELGHSVAMMDQFGFPILFVAKDHMLLNDVAGGTVVFEDNTNPNLIIQVAEGKCTAVCGVATKNDSSFVVDLPSFVTKSTPRIREAENGVEVSYTSTSGVETVFMFDNTSRINSMTCSYRGEPLIVVRDIVLNQPLPERLTEFPSRDEIPEDIRVEVWSDKDAGSESEARQRTVLLMRALGLSAALSRPELRNVPPYKSVVDWDELGRMHQANGPRLAKLLGFEATDIRRR